MSAWLFRSHLNKEKKIDDEKKRINKEKRKENSKNMLEMNECEKKRTTY